MKLSVISCAYGGGGYEKSFRLRDSCGSAGLPLHLYGIGLSWPECKQGKLIDLSAPLRELRSNGYKYALWSDAFDSFVCPGTTEEAILKEFNAYSILFSAEKNCYPYPHLKGRYQNCSKSPWKYICAGGWIADIEYLLDYLPRVIEWEDPSSNDDQGIWTKAYLNHNLPDARLDYRCQIFQAMHQSGEPFAASATSAAAGGKYIVNPVTRSLPMVIHFNGSSYGADGRLDRFYNEVMR